MDIGAMLTTAINEHKFGDITNVNELYSKFAKSTNIRFNIKNLIRFVNEYQEEVDQSDNFLWFAKFDLLILTVNRIRVLNKLGKIAMIEKAERIAKYGDNEESKTHMKMNEFIFNKINNNPNFLIDNERCLDYIDPSDDNWFCMKYEELHDFLLRLFDYFLCSKIIKNVRSFKKYDYDEAFLEVLNHKDIAWQLDHAKEDKFNPYLTYPEAFTNDKRIMEDYMDLKERIDNYQYAFWSRYGYIPKVIATIAKVDPEDPFTKFNGRGLKALLKQFGGFDNATLAVKSMYLVGCETAKNAGKKIMELVFTGNHPDEFVTKYRNTFKWMIKNKKASTKLLTKAMAMAEILPENVMDMSIAEVRQFLVNSKGMHEIKRAEEEWDFKFNECKFELPQLAIENKKYIAKLLEAGDYSMATIGYDTNCCQHMGSAGETSMIYGITAPKAGFWVSKKNNIEAEIEAQAMVWEGKLKAKSEEDNSLDRKPVFVFDNIEYANDGDINKIYELLKEWVKNYPYDNIVMGVGYNQTRHLNLFTKCEYKLRMLKSPTIKRKDVYTDANKSVWLKKNGKLMFPN